MHDPPKNVYDVHDPIRHLIAALWHFLNISCLSVPNEHVASQSKWQSADLAGPPKTSEEEEKCVASAIPR